MADFEKRTQNLIMIMVWKKSWRPTLKKEHKTWLWLWFWKNKNKKLTPTLKKEHKTWLWLWFWGKKFDGRLWKKNTKLDYDYGLKKNNKIDRRLWKKNTKLDYDYGFEKEKKSWRPTEKTHKTGLWLWFWKKKELTADFEKNPQNLIMIMILKKKKKVDSQLWKKEHKTWLWLWFWKKNNKKCDGRLWKKNTWLWGLWFWKKKCGKKNMCRKLQRCTSLILSRERWIQWLSLYIYITIPSIQFPQDILMSESHCWNYWNWNSLSEYDNIDKVSTEHNITSTGVLWLKRIGEEKNCSPQNIIHHTLKSSYIMQILKCATYSKLSTNDAVSVLDHSPRPWCPLPMEQKKDLIISTHLLCTTKIKHKRKSAPLVNVKTTKANNTQINTNYTNQNFH